MFGIEDEDPTEYFDDEEDVRELLDLFLTTRRLEEATKAKLKELDRLAELGVYESVGLHVTLGKKRLTTRWHLDRSKDGIRARFVRKRVQG